MKNHKYISSNNININNRKYKAMTPMTKEIIEIIITQLVSQLIDNLPSWIHFLIQFF